jgi:hypothetical protein
MYERRSFSILFLVTDPHFSYVILIAHFKILYAVPLFDGMFFIYTVLAENKILCSYFAYNEGKLLTGWCMILFRIQK